MWFTVSEEQTHIGGFLAVYLIIEEIHKGPIIMSIIRLELALKKPLWVERIIPIGVTPLSTPTSISFLSRS